MTSLNSELRRLFEWLSSIDMEPPRREIRIVEVNRDVWRSSDPLGRLVFPATAIREPKDYESRFDELLHSGLAWIDLSCYGVYNGFIIAAVETPDVPIDRAGVMPTAVNLSGPPNMVVESGWDASTIMTLV